jgi:hypothetical protein
MNDERGMGRLRLVNAAMGLLHAVQGFAVLLLSNDFALPITAAFMEGPPGTPASTEELFTLPLGPAVAGFLFLSAVAHFVVAGPGWGKYRRDLAAHRNEQRWIEYSLSSSVMIVLIAMITGIADIAALVALFGVNAAMILFGWLQERYEEPGGGGWRPFVFGCVAGVVPWVAIGIYLLGPTAEIPGFVYAIFVSLFLFFNSFAINQLLQYRRVGPWREYRFGENVYVGLSLVAKSALAWQVFANTLVPT